MIDVEGLTKDYGPTRSLHDVTFSVGEGEVMGFLGPNGAGKSTTMRILVGLARATSGTARIGGHDVQADNARMRSILGYLPESAPLYGDMTVERYLRFMAGLKGLGFRDARREADRASSAVNLQKERQRLLRNLSKGTRQRAAIAQALLGDPKVLILDEPTVGLDPAQINDVRELVRGMRGRRTVILSTHILPEVELTCNRIAIINAGRVIAEGTRAELVESRGATLHVTVRGEAAKLAEAIRTVLGTRVEARSAGPQSSVILAPCPGDLERGRIARAVVEAGLDLVEMRVEHPSLEDVFLSAIGGRREVGAA